MMTANQAALLDTNSVSRVMLPAKPARMGQYLTFPPSI